MNNQSVVCFFFLIFQVLLHNTEGTLPDLSSIFSRRNTSSGVKNIVPNIPGTGAVQSAVDTAVDTAGKVVDYVVPDCLFGANQIGFILYTREIPKGLEVSMNSTNIPLTGRKTIFLIHGFASEANNTNYQDLSNALLALGPFNVISVDWKKGACSGEFAITDTLAFPSAVQNTVAVGNHIANFTKKLHDKYEVKVNETIVFGHSLGAHVAGFAGKRVQKMGLGLYELIVGLDPAGPGFEGASCENRLCETDAKFVIAFHTTVLLGIHQNVGNNDFFFNGATNQPNCLLVTCAHSRAVVYLTEIVKYRDCRFVGTGYNKTTGDQVEEDQCTVNDCSIASPASYILPSRGAFYVKTKRDEPYCSTEPVKFLDGFLPR